MFVLVFLCMYVCMCVCVCLCIDICVCVCVCVLMLLYLVPVHCTVTIAHPGHCPFWSSSDVDTSECDYNHCTVHWFSDKFGMTVGTLAVGRQRGTSKKVSPQILSRGFENVRTFANLSGKLSTWIFREQKLAVCRKNLWKR
jgi:hypothetical protein